MKTLGEYEQEVARTMSGSLDGRDGLVSFALGIAGEAGEVADLIKKHLGHGHPLDAAKLEKELGDVLWYVAALARRCGLTLQGVAEANKQKLRARFPDGFSTEASLRRSDEPLKAGDPVRFRAPNGSRGRIDGPNHYGGFYVTWHYGQDKRGELMTATSSVRVTEIERISEEELASSSNREGFGGGS